MDDQGWNAPPTSRVDEAVILFERFLAAPANSLAQAIPSQRRGCGALRFGAVGTLDLEKSVNAVVDDVIRVLENKPPLYPAWQA